MLSKVDYMKNAQLSRGLRNNNPLNIRHSASKWQGMAPEQKDKAFVQFTTMQMGYRAAWRVLETYYHHFKEVGKLFTIRNIIYRWAPPNENNTEAYLKRVCQLVTIDSNAVLLRPSIADEEDLKTLTDLLVSMTCVENGVPSDTVDRNVIETAYRLAF